MDVTKLTLKKVEQRKLVSKTCMIEVSLFNLLFGYE